MRLGFAASIEHPPGDPQLLCRQGFIALGPFQHGMNDGVFEVGQRPLADSERQVDHERVDLLRRAGGRGCPGE